MSNIEIKVIKKKKESLILSVVMIILCIISLIFFSSDYLKVLNNEYVNINNSKSLEDAIKNKERYVRADLRKAKLEVYSLENKILFLEFFIYLPPFFTTDTYIMST